SLIPLWTIVVAMISSPSFSCQRAERQHCKPASTLFLAKALPFEADESGLWRHPTLGVRRGWQPSPARRGSVRVLAQPPVLAAHAVFPAPSGFYGALKKLTTSCWNRRWPPCRCIM